MGAWLSRLFLTFRGGICFCVHEPSAPPFCISPFVSFVGRCGTTGFVCLASELSLASERPHCHAARSYVSALVAIGFAAGCPREVIIMRIGSINALDSR